MLFITWAELVFPFTRVVVLSTTTMGTKDVMLESFILASHAKEPMLKEGEYDVLSKIKPTFLLAIIITTGYVDKIISPPYPGHF